MYCGHKIRRVTFAKHFAHAVVISGIRIIALEKTLILRFNAKSKNPSNNTKKYGIQIAINQDVFNHKLQLFTV